MRGSRSYSPPPRRSHGGRGGRSPLRGRHSYRDAPNSLLVRNIPRSCRPEDVRYFFERFGRIKDVYLPRDYYSGEPRGFGFVQYLDPADAAEAKYRMDHNTFYGREITVVFAEERRKRPEEMRVKERFRSPTGHGGSRRSPNYGRSRSRSPHYSPSPRQRRHSRSHSPAPRRERYRSHSISPRGREHSPRSRSESPPKRRDASHSPDGSYSPRSKDDQAKVRQRSSRSRSQSFSRSRSRSHSCSRSRSRSRSRSCSRSRSFAPADSKSPKSPSRDSPVCSPSVPRKGRHQRSPSIESAQKKPHSNRTPEERSPCGVSISPSR